MGERETYRVPLKLQAKMASLSLIPSNKKRFPSWIDSGSLSPSPLNFNSNHEKSQQRKTETFIFVLFNTKRHINSLSTSTKLTNLQQKISILPRIVGDVGQSEQPHQSCCLSPASAVVESVVLRRKKKIFLVLFYFHISFGPSLSCPWLLLLLYTLRRAESDIIVEASGDEITVMEREEEDLHLQAKGAPRIHTTHTHCVYYLSLFLCVCCVWWLRCLGVVAVVGWLRIFLSFSFLSDWLHTHTHSHPEEKEHTHQSAMGSVKGRRFDRVWMRVWKISSFWSSEKWNGEKEK
jgi:hypothetical protein